MMETHSRKARKEKKSDDDDSSSGPFGLWTMNRNQLNKHIVLRSKQPRSNEFPPGFHSVSLLRYFFSNSTKSKSTTSSSLLSWSNDDEQWQVFFPDRFGYLSMELWPTKPPCVHIVSSSWISLPVSISRLATDTEDHPYVLLSL